MEDILCIYSLVMIIINFYNSNNHNHEAMVKIMNIL